LFSIEMILFSFICALPIFEVKLLVFYTLKDVGSRMETA